MIVTPFDDRLHLEPPLHALESRQRLDWIASSSGTPCPAASAAAAVAFNRIVLARPSAA
jgi:hypothetical protein